MALADLSAAPVTVTCTRVAGTPAVYTPGAPGTLSVTGPSAGQAFSVSGNPAWLTPGAPSGSAGTTAATVSLTVNAGCGGFAAGTSTVATLILTNTGTNTGYSTVSVTVTLITDAPTPLTALPAANVTYVKGSGAAGTTTISVKSSSTPSPYFTVNSSTLPVWLTASPAAGTATAGGATVTLTTTSICDSMAPGSYTATLHLSVSGSFDQTVVVNLFLNTGAPTLSVTGSLLRSSNWTIGTAVPTYTITAVSSDSPIAYTATASGALGPIVQANEVDGLAYSFGTPINVTFNPAVFAAAQPGQVLTGTVTLTWGATKSTIVVSFSITVQAPGATVTGLSPATLPASAPGTTFSVSITGTGFVTSTDPTQRTKVGFTSNGSSGGNLVADSAITNVNVVSSSLIIVTIVAPPTAANDTNLNFGIATGSATSYLGVCNPAVANPCPVISGFQPLTISAGPLIQAVTSSSSFVQVTPPALPSMAPYDMVSIFGAGFCPGCSTGQVLLGAPNAATLTYVSTPVLTPNPNAVSPAVPNYVTVSFLTHPSGALIANAPLLFATNGQINLLVPSVLTPGIVDIEVNYGPSAGPLTSSARFPVTIAATDPGIFTVGADGQGSAAVLDTNYNLITAANPAGMRSGAVHTGDSDTIQLYVTGLGLPDTGASWNATNCITPAAYITALAASTGNTLTTIDGTVIQSSLLNGEYAPCLLSTNTHLPTVTIGGIPATVTFAGMVADTIAGLYQINVTLPSTVQTGSNYFVPLSGVTNEVQTLISPMQLPVVITTGSTPSQQGVTLWVAPRLYVAAPTLSSCSQSTCAVGIQWPNTNTTVTAAEGTPPYHYSVTTGVLPAGLTLNAATGLISGTPAANTAGAYPITVTVSDSANIPLTGTATFTLNVAGGLVMTSSANTGTGTFATADTTTLPLITPTGGTFPYTFAISSSPAPLGMTVVPAGCTNGANPCTNGADAKIETAASTPAGTYVINVTATDSAATPVTGTVNAITITVAPKLTVSSTTAQAAGSGLVLVTATAQTGNINGTVVYTLNEYTNAGDGTALGSASGLALDPSTGVLTTGTASAGTYYLTITATDSGVEPQGSTAFGTATTANITVTVQ